MRSDVVEITACIRRDRERTIAIWDGSIDEDGAELWTWLPKSQIQVEMKSGGAMIVLPQWLARERGLTADVEALQVQVGHLSARVHHLEARLAQLERRLRDERVRQ